MRAPLIQHPCNARWEEMPGDERARVCAQCALPVHDLTALTHEETAAVLAVPPGQPRCVRVTRGPDGELQNRSTKRADLVSLLQRYAARRQGG